MTSSSLRSDEFASLTSSIFIGQDINKSESNSGNQNSAGFWKTHLAISGQGAANLRNFHQTLVIGRPELLLARVVSCRLRLIPLPLSNTCCSTCAATFEDLTANLPRHDNDFGRFRCCGVNTEHHLEQVVYLKHPLWSLRCFSSYKGVLVASTLILVTLEGRGHGTCNSYIYISKQIQV